MKKIIFLLVLMVAISCSKDESNDSGSNVVNVMTITLKKLNYNKATISWTRPSNAAAGTVLYEIILNSQVVKENYQNTQYEFLGLLPETTYNVTVTALDTEGKETFDQISFTTLEDTRPPPITYNGNLRIVNQAQMEGFSFKNILGYLIIEGSGITDISNLATIEHVSSYVRVVQTSLQNLNGLQNVVGYDVSNSGGGFLYLHNNNQLTDISAANQYLSVGRSIEFKANPLLQDISGITMNETLRTVRIESMPLSNLNFLSNVTSIENEFYLMDLPNLMDSSGLASMVFSGDSYKVDNVPQLTSLQGSFMSIATQMTIQLNNLASLSNLDLLSGLVELRDLRLQNLPALTNFDGLNSLERLRDMILYELQISNLDGFSNLTDGPKNWGILFYVNDNPNLTDFCGVTTYMRNTGIRFDDNGIYREFSVSGNAYNPTESQIESTVECSQ